VCQWRKRDAEDVYSLVRTGGSRLDSRVWRPLAATVVAMEPVLAEAASTVVAFMPVWVAAGSAEKDFADVGLEDMALSSITADTFLTRTTTTTTTAAATWSVAA
jgi:hypothetical protein